MNIWITKNIKFGYKYTINKSSREEILESTNWLINLIKNKSNKDDIFILSGGLFSNTNPSIVAINDAHNFLLKLKNICNIYLVNSSKDNRLYEGDYYSTLDIFNYVNIIDDITTISNITIIPFNKTFTNGISLDVESGIFNTDKIPNLMQLEENDGDQGVIVYNDIKQKHIFLENKISPKHETIIINNIKELKELSDNIPNNHIHIVIDKTLIDNHKTQTDVLLFKINPVSIKYTDDKYDEIVDDVNINSIDVDDAIISHIGDNEELLTQFNRIKLILDNK
ncbi:MAG: hypothetical protein WDA02_10690 [Saccharofermentanales bacterium]